MARQSLLNSLPRLASTVPLRWAMFAECEWPAMILPDSRGGANGPDRDAGIGPIGGSFETDSRRGCQARLGRVARGRLGRRRELAQRLELLADLGEPLVGGDRL